MADVQLLGFWASPYSRRIEIALKLKGIEYEYIEQDLTNKSRLLLQYNPFQKKIPVIIHNGKPIAESIVILEYLDETWKANPILPSDPYDKAMARFWAKFIDKKLFGVKRTRERKRLRKYKITSKYFKGKKFFGGDTIGFVDIVANPIGFWLEIIQEAAGIEMVTREKFPILFKWMDDFVNHGVIKECLPPREKVVGHLKP